MIQYLDLQRNVREKPNENFARELFELFMLGEGNYTEADIKNAARSFTGYKTDGTQFRFVARQHDDGVKRIFGKRGNFTGDDVIDQAMGQAAAGTFLPSEFLRFYLSSEVTLERPYVERLGQLWQQQDFSIGALIRTVFQSRLFYHAAFRGNMIKSPVQFYIGLVQDLNLDITPFPNPTLNDLRNMGQPFYAPPNVRGWLGGKAWINASTLTARRQTVERLFQPVRGDRLNADDYAELMVARLEGRDRLSVDSKNLQSLLAPPDDKVIDRITRYFLANRVDQRYLRNLKGYLREGEGDRGERLRTIVITILQSPQYNLC